MTITASRPARIGWRRGGAAAVMAAGVALTGCGAAAGGHQSVAVGRTPATKAKAAASRPASRASGSAATCRASQLRADQVPVSSGTGQSYLAWSLTNTASTSCVLPAGQPSLAFVGTADHAVVDYTVTHLANPAADPADPADPAGAAATSAGADADLTVAPGHAAWFLTEESSTNCGTGTVVAGGPFHYVVSLPGGAGSVTWTASYLSGRTLSDFCGSVALGVGDLQSTEPGAG